MGDDEARPVLQAQAGAADARDEPRYRGARP